MSPEISIVMPVYNGAKYLEAAIDSILNQSFKEWELIIINDGSTDNTEALIKNYTDERIVYLNNSQNLGLAKSFNIGINAARGTYIARMDADDMSVNDRLEKELGFLKTHPDIDIVGTAVQLIDENGHGSKIASKPLTHLELKWQSLLSTPFFHPTILTTAGVLKANPFDESLFNSEDYELWSRLLFGKNMKFANLSEPLLLYRVSKNSFTQSLNKEKRIASANYSIKNIEHYLTLTPEERNLFTKSRIENHLSFSEFLFLKKLYKRMAGAFALKENFTPPLLSHTLSLFKQVLK